MSGKSYVILDQRGVLAVGGGDRRSFLQGLVSNDVEAVSGERAVYAAFLTPQGKYLHDFFMVEVGNEILVDCEGGERLDDLKKRLSMYKLRADVTIEERSGDLAVFALFGEGAAEALGVAADDAGAAKGFIGGAVYVDPRLARAGARAILPVDRAVLSIEGAGFEVEGFSAYDTHRTHLGLPDGSRDLVVEKSILLENGFEELNGVSFDKGCYMGQELTSRTKHRALIKKRLMPVDLDGEAPEAGTPVMAGDTEAGEMRSSAGTAGLALIRLEHFEAAVGNPFTCGAAKLTPKKPDWANF